MRKETGMQTDPRKGEEKFTAGPGTYTLLPLTPINQLLRGTGQKMHSPSALIPFLLFPH